MGRVVLRRVVFGASCPDPPPKPFARELYRRAHGATALITFSIVFYPVDRFALIRWVVSSLQPLSIELAVSEFRLFKFLCKSGNLFTETVPQVFLKSIRLCCHLFW